MPYFGVCLKDLTFLHDGNPDYVRFGLPNVAKWRRIVQVLKEITTSQATRYNLIVIKEIQTFLSEIKPLDEDTIFARSKEFQATSQTTASSKADKKQIRSYSSQGAAHATADRFVRQRCCLSCLKLWSRCLTRWWGPLRVA